MDAIRLFLNSNSFRNSRIKTDSNSKNVISTDSLIEPKTDEISIRRNSSNEKFSRDNIKSFLSSHPSSSSLSSCYPLNSSQLETCSGLSIPNSINTKDQNVVASASASISNARSFTWENYSKKDRKIQQRRHSWTGEENLHHIHLLSSTIRRTKSFRFQNRTKKNSTIHNYPTDKIVRKIIQVNRSTKSVSFPLSSNINNRSLSIPSTQIRSVKTTATNAFLTAGFIFKYWVHVIKFNISYKASLIFLLFSSY